MAGWVGLFDYGISSRETAVLEGKRRHIRLAIGFPDYRSVASTQATGLEDFAVVPLNDGGVSGSLPGFSSELLLQG